MTLWAVLRAGGQDFELHGGRIEQLNDPCGCWKVTWRMDDGERARLGVLPFEQLQVFSDDQLLSTVITGGNAPNLAWPVDVTYYSNKEPGVDTETAPAPHYAEGPCGHAEKGPHPMPVTGGGLRADRRRWWQR